jgi:hypothetical protein
MDECSPLPAVFENYEAAPEAVKRAFNTQNNRPTFQALISLMTFLSLLRY